MSAIIAFGFGFFMGTVVVALIFRRLFVGDLRIDHSDWSDAPYPFLELSKEFSEVVSKRYVILRVRIEDFIPHE